MDASTDELTALAPLAGDTITLGEGAEAVQVTVRKLRVNQVPHFTRAIRPLLDDVAAMVGGEGEVGAIAMSLLDDRFEQVVDVLAAATVQFGRDWTDDQKDKALRDRRLDIASATVEQAGELLVGVLALNKDFLHGRLTQALRTAVLVKRGAGQTQSPA